MHIQDVWRRRKKPIFWEKVFWKDKVLFCFINEALEANKPLLLTER